jgi:transcriptional regulator with XRE-family HTH domain
MGGDIYVLVGKRLQVLRKAHDLTQAELAEKADLTTGYLAKLEGGGKKARLEVLERIAVALGEPMWRFFADDRPTISEERWLGEARKLAEVVQHLSEADVRALLGVAQQLAERARS